MLLGWRSLTTHLFDESSVFPASKKCRGSIVFHAVSIATDYVLQWSLLPVSVQYNYNYNYLFTVGWQSTSLPEALLELDKSDQWPLALGQFMNMDKPLRFLTQKEWDSWTWHIVFFSHMVRALLIDVCSIFVSICLCVCIAYTGLHGKHCTNECLCTSGIFNVCVWVVVSAVS